MVGTPKAKFDPLTDVIFIHPFSRNEARKNQKENKTRRCESARNSSSLNIACVFVYVMIPIFAQHIFL